LSSTLEPQPETAAVVIIGDEVLTGKTQDTNSHWLAAELYALGVSLERVVVIPDRVEVIAQTVAELSTRFGVVFTSGGVGPTHDDLTYAGVARAFGVPLQRSEELVERIRLHYRGPLNEERLKMADIPRPDELCFTEGMLTPVVRIRNVLMLPGVPELFRQLVGAMRERFRLRPVFLGEIFTRQAEGDIAAALNSVVALHPLVRIGSYPRLGRSPYRVKITVESHEEQVAQAAYDEILSRLEADGVVDQHSVAVVVPPAGHLE